MTATPETVTTVDTDKPHVFLAGLAQQGSYAYQFAKTGRREEAAEHLAATERLITAYRLAAGEWDTEAVHLHFSLSYANYLVLPRTLLQSMPDEWQARFVALVDEIAEAFTHVPQAEIYKVEAATEHEVGDLNEVQRKELGITADWYRGETPPDGLSAQDLTEWRAKHENPEGPEYSDANGNELRWDERVLLPAVDPVPHYNRGRARVEPRLGGGE